MINKDFLKNITVLYVEDDEIIRKELSDVLNKVFKSVIIAFDGKEAIEKYNQEKNNIDVIVSDIVMPELTGLDLLNIIREENKEIPFIFTTAYSESQYLIEALKQGVNDYFIKPLDISELLIKIQELTSKTLKEKNLQILQNETQEYLNTINKVAIVFVFDKNENIIYVNEFYKELSNYEEDEVLGKNFSTIYHSDISKDIIKKQIESLFEKDEEWKGKLKFHSKDDNPFYTNCTIVPFSTQDHDKFIAINFITTKEENNRREFKKKVLYNFNETKKIYKMAQDKINVLSSKLNSFDGYEKKENSLNSLKDENINHLNKIQELESKLKKIRTKHEIFTNDVNRKIKMIAESTNEMKDFTIKSDKKITHIKREILVREHFIAKITEELNEKRKKVKDLEDVLQHRDSQVEDKKDSSRSTNDLNLVKDS